jgi:hypothetical protein
MAGTISQYQQGAFATPINGTSADASVVLSNDNATRAKHNSHDSDATIHVQSSVLASRPGAGTAQRLWVTTDGLRAYLDTGAVWNELDYLSRTAGGTVAGAVTLSSLLTVNADAQFANLRITANGLAETATNATTVINVNTVGYNQGTTQFRDFAVADGKGANVMYLTGSSKAASFFGNVLVNAGALQALTQSAGTNLILQTSVSGDAANRFNLSVNGTFNWGAGAGAQDVNLYRLSAGILKTDQKITAALGFILPNAVPFYANTNAGTATTLLYRDTSDRAVLDLNALPLRLDNVSTAATASAGASGAVPAQVYAYLPIVISGVTYKIPVFNT